MDKDIENYAWKMVESYVDMQLDGYVPKTLTMLEALSILPTNTSPGWPWTTRWPTKAQFYSSTDFFEVAKYAYDQTIRSNLPLFLDTVFLKDEMREREKCGPGQARAVFCPDAVAVLIQAMWKKDFDKALISQVGSIFQNSAIAVGMSPFFGSFKRLAAKFEPFTCFEMDMSACDSTMCWRVQKRIALIRSNAMNLDEMSQNVMRDLFFNNCFSRAVLPDGRVASRFTGNPSGQASTTMDDCLFVLFIVIYCFSAITGLRVPFHKLHTLIALIVFGDDTLLGVNPKLEFSLDTFRMMATRVWGANFSGSAPSKLTDLKWFNCTWGYRTFRGRNFLLPMLDPAKTVASLALCGEKPLMSPEKVLERSLSIRAMAWANEQLFKYVDAYCAWLIRVYFGGKSPLKVHTELVLFSLFTGFESRGLAHSGTQSCLIKLLNLVCLENQHNVVIWREDLDIVEKSLCLKECESSMLHSLNPKRIMRKCQQRFMVKEQWILLRDMPLKKVSLQRPN